MNRCRPHDNDCVRVVINIPETDRQYQRKLAALYQKGIYTADNEFCLSPVRQTLSCCPVTFVCMRVRMRVRLL